MDQYEWNLLPDIERSMRTLANEQIVLLVSSNTQKLDTVADELCHLNGWPSAHINQAVAEMLSKVPPNRRPIKAGGALLQHLGTIVSAPVVCTGIDLLFEPSLELDPLALFVRASREVQLIVCWPGTYIDKLLCYAVPGHGHHRCSWRRTDIPFILV